jgi:hypothetical protein
MPPGLLRTPYSVLGQILAVVCLALLGASGCARRTVSVDPVARAAEPQQPAVAKPGPKEPPAGADRAGAIVQRALSPSDRLPPLETERPSGPRRLAAATRLDAPEPGLPALQLDLPPSRPALAGAPLRLRPLAEELPPATSHPPPGRLALSSPPRVRVWSPDPGRSIDVPPLGVYREDNGLTEDVTAEASRATVLAQVTPERLGPTPFHRFTVPEPFEFRRPSATAGEPAGDMPTPRPPAPPPLSRPQRSEK